MKKLFIVALFLLGPGILSAQTITTGSGDIGLILNPANPGPNATTTAKITSYVINVGASNIAWQINGKTISSGIGKNLISFKTGALGTKTALKVSAINDGRKFEKTVTIYQNDIDLLWEVIDGYAPGFYRGKIFPAPGTIVRVATLPNLFINGKQVPADKINYRWKVNFKNLPGQSGPGKQTISFVADTSTNNNVVEVEATALNDAGLTIRKSVAIPSPSLQIIVYQAKPLVGALYGSALKGSWQPVGNEPQLKAEIFNVWQSDYYNLEFKWLLNGRELPLDQANPQILTLDASEATTSRSFLTVVAENPANIFQTARELLTVYSGNSVQF